MLSPEDHVLEGDPEEVEKRLRRLTSVGRALDDVEIAILDENGAPLPQGQEGEVAARGPRLMSGYWGDDQATRSAFHHDWLLTGDRGYLDEDSYLYLSGRSKDFIKRGGEMISPQEVEDALLSHPGVQEAAVIGVPDTQWGERVRAVVIPPTRSPPNSRRSHPALPPPPGKLQAPGIGGVRDRDPQKSHGQSPQARPPLPLQFPHPQPRC